jgi:hypothetical protein
VFRQPLFSWGYRVLEYDDTDAFLDDLRGEPNNAGGRESDFCHRRALASLGLCSRYNLSKAWLHAELSLLAKAVDIAIADLGCTKLPEVRHSIPPGYVNSDAHGEDERKSLKSSSWLTSRQRMRVSQRLMAWDAMSSP